MLEWLRRMLGDPSRAPATDRRRDLAERQRRQAEIAQEHARAARGRESLRLPFPF